MAIFLGVGLFMILAGILTSFYGGKNDFSRFEGEVILIGGLILCAIACAAISIKESLIKKKGIEKPPYFDV